ncbi:MAG TPA: exodeoxyribonuclease III [Erysipelothrix sp.]|nr:exodeoxyribonuclease III [Erysipelothrix sp.]
MKLVSWNVNGFRAVLKKGFEKTFKELDADIFCLQETKMQPDQHDFEPEGYYMYFNSAVRKGYSSTALFSKVKPLSVHFGINIDHHDQEGRVITAEFESFYVVTVYTPNAQRDLARLDYRMTWEDDFQNYIDQLDAKKPVIVCGDLNVAHQPIDLKNPTSNRKNAGFTEEERSKMTQFLGRGYVDSFRYLYPDLENRYTWWSYMFESRQRNVGWRIDYFLVSERLKSAIEEALILDHIMGSDHCPVALILNNNKG